MAIYSMEAEHSLDHCPIIYKGKDNPLCLVLKEDEQDMDYTGAQVVRCKVGKVEFDSVADPNAFDVTESQCGKMKIMIGEQSGIVAQAHDVRVEIVTGEGKTLYFGKVRVRVEDPGM